jgi:hypothetical protein
VTEKEEVQKRRYMELDKNGKPRGKMADLMKHDVQAFTKELDPNVGWDKQKEEAKRRLKQRFYAQYELGGNCDMIGEKYRLK